MADYTINLTSEPLKTSDRYSPRDLRSPRLTCNVGTLIEESSRGVEGSRAPVGSLT